MRVLLLQDSNEDTLTESDEEWLEWVEILETAPAAANKPRSKVRKHIATTRTDIGFVHTRNLICIANTQLEAQLGDGGAGGDALRAAPGASGSEQLRALLARDDLFARFSSRFSRCAAACLRTADPRPAARLRPTLSLARRLFSGW